MVPRSYHTVEKAFLKQIHMLVTSDGWHWQVEKKRLHPHMDHRGISRASQYVPAAP